MRTFDTFRSLGIVTLLVLSVGKKDGIDDVDDAVGLVDIGDGEFEHAAFFIDKDDVLAPGVRLEPATVFRVSVPLPALRALQRSLLDILPA
jgi:hypothetical protein